MPLAQRCLQESILRTISAVRTDDRLLELLSILQVRTEDVAPVDTTAQLDESDRTERFVQCLLASAALQPT